MARPIKYFGDEREQAATRGALLIREIRELSGLGSQKLADALRPDIELSAEIIRKYSQGKAPISESRERQLALAAARRGWVGPRIKESLFYDPSAIPATSFFAKSGTAIQTDDEFWKTFTPDHSPSQKTEMAARNRNARRALKLAEQRVVKQLQMSFAVLGDLGWSDASMMALAARLSQRNVDADEKTNGGLYSPQFIEKLLGTASANFPESAWIQWNDSAVTYNEKSPSE